MKIIATTLTLLLFALSFQVVSAADKATYKIGNEFAKFYIPVKPQDSYRRFKTDTPDGGLEYAAAIAIGTSQVGHFLYKYPGAAEIRTSLLDILARGQKSVWINENGSSVVSDRHSVDVYYSQPYIVISITNPETLKLLEGENEVTIFVKGFETPLDNLLIKIDE